MASFAPIALTIPNYRDFKNFFLKAFEPGTTSPKVMATDKTGNTTVAKFELDKDGFPKTSGGALITPYINGSYDLWAFPTEAEADANDTGNALRFAIDVEATDPNALIDRLNPATLAIWQADTSAQAGDVVTTAERTAGFGGGATGEVIAGTGTANGTNIVAHNTLSLSWVLRVNSTTTVLEMGAVPDATGVAGVGTDNTAAFQDLTDLALPIKIPIGKFRITAAIDRINATWIGERNRTTSADIGSEVVCDDSIFTGRFIPAPLAMRDIIFTGTSKAGTCLSVERSDPAIFHGWTHFENIRIRGFDLGVFIGNSFITNFDSVVIEENNKAMDVKPNDFVTTLYFNDVVMRENSIYALDFDSPTKSPNIHFTNWNVENNGGSGTFQVRMRNADPCLFHGGYIENEPSITAFLNAGGNFISTKSWFVNNTGGINLGTGTFTGDFNRIKMVGASPGVIKANGGANQTLEFKNSSILFDGGTVPSINNLTMLSTEADGTLYNHYEVGSGVNFQLGGGTQIASIEYKTNAFSGQTITPGSSSTLANNVSASKIMLNSAGFAHIRGLYSPNLSLLVTTASTSGTDFYSVVAQNLGTSDVVLSAGDLDIFFMKGTP